MTARKPKKPPLRRTTKVRDPKDFVLLDMLRTALKSMGLRSLDTLAKEGPFRISTPDNHERGAWIADVRNQLGISDIHPRGLQYLLINAKFEVTLPTTGEQYGVKHYEWLKDSIKAARWLNYVPFHAFVDKRNKKGKTNSYRRPRPRAEIKVDFDFEVPTVEDLSQLAHLRGFFANQPYRLVFVGEKDSLEDVLEPLAEEFGADLYLPKGDISDTRLLEIGLDAAKDPRPVIVIYFADCDPSGNNMAVSAAERLLALKHLGLLPKLNLRVFRAALTPDQVREHDLLWIPVVEGDKRKERWESTTGVGQTEIDALATMDPDVLEEITRESVRPFLDDTLNDRVTAARAEWEADAQDAIDEAGGQELAELIAETADWFADVKAEADRRIGAIEELARTLGSDDLPALPPIPTADLDDVEMPEPILDTNWSFIDQMLRLRAERDYGRDEATAAGTASRHHHQTPTHVRNFI